MALYENIVPLLTPGYNLVNIELSLKTGDRFIMYTDGIIESTNSAGDLFGWSHFKEFIASHANLSVGNFADELIQRNSSWSGKHLDEALPVTEQRMSHAKRFRYK